MGLKCETSQVFKSVFNHLAQYSDLHRLEAASEMRRQQISAIRHKQIGNVIDGQPRRVQRSVLPRPLGAYLEMGGHCWYVLGCDRNGDAIAKPNEIPIECGVMVF